MARLLPAARRRRRFLLPSPDAAQAAAILALLALALVTVRATISTPAAQRATVDAPPPALLAGAARALDGDTLELDGVRVRLWGIDAPEAAQPCVGDEGASAAGERATDHLAALVARAPAVCDALGEDRYGRILARCRVDGREIAAAMVESGWARDYAQYSDGAYAREERAARSSGRGLWRWQCAAPWRWRRETRGA